MLNTSKTKTRERCLIFICPKLLKHETYWEAGDFNGFDFVDVIRGVSFDTMNRMSKSLTGKELNKKAYKNYQQEGEYQATDKEGNELMDSDDVYDFKTFADPFQSEWVDTCKGFGGTGVEVDIYRFILV